MLRQRPEPPMQVIWATVIDMHRSCTRSSLPNAACIGTMQQCANDVAAVPNGCYRAQREHSVREHLMIYVAVLRARIYVMVLRAHI